MFHNMYMLSATLRWLQESDCYPVRVNRIRTVIDNQVQTHVSNRIATGYMSDCYPIPVQGTVMETG